MNRFDIINTIGDKYRVGIQKLVSLAMFKH